MSPLKSKMRAVQERKKEMNSVQSIKKEIFVAGGSLFHLKTMFDFFAYIRKTKKCNMQHFCLKYLNTNFVKFSYAFSERLFIYMDGII